MSLLVTLTQLRPTRRLWLLWGRREPVLAEVDYPTFRAELANSSQHREDELLAAVVRLARHDPVAAELVTACMWPGLMSRIAKYAPGLDRDEAVAIAAAGLVTSFVRFSAVRDPAPRYVAGWLLRIPSRHLWSAAKRERTRVRISHQLPDLADGRHNVDLRARTLLGLAVSARVLGPADAWVLHAVDVEGHSLSYAAQRLGLSYEATKKRRQRAKCRWGRWWVGAPDSDPVPPTTERSEEAVA